MQQKIGVIPLGGLRSPAIFYDTELGIENFERTLEILLGTTGDLSMSYVRRAGDQLSPDEIKQLEGKHGTHSRWPDLQLFRTTSVLLEYSLGSGKPLQELIGFFYNTLWLQLLGYEAIPKVGNVETASHHQVGLRLQRLVSTFPRRGLHFRRYDFFPFEPVTQNVIDDLLVVGLMNQIAFLRDEP